MTNHRLDKKRPKIALDSGLQKRGRGRPKMVDPLWVAVRAANYRGILKNVWDELWPLLSLAKTEDEVKEAFQKGYPGEHEFMPRLAPQVLEVLTDPTFPKLRNTRINFMADSLAALGDVSLRRSRDICAEERARAERTHHIIRCEMYVECTCGYKGPSLDHACPECRAAIPEWLIPTGLPI